MKSLINVLNSSLVFVFLCFCVLITDFEGDDVDDDHDDDDVDDAHS